MNSIWVPRGKVWAAREAGPGLTEVWQFGVPLPPMLFGEWPFRLGDRYVLLAFSGIEHVAVYTVSMNIALIIHLVMLNVIGLVVPEFNRVNNRLPPADQAMPPRDPRLRRLAGAMLRHRLIAGVIGGIGLVVFRRQVVALLCGPEFAGDADVLPWAASVSVFFLVHLVFSRVLIA